MGFQLHNGGEFFHKLLGGKTLKGWIPARPGRQVVWGYNPQNPVALENISKDHITKVGGYAVMVPVAGDKIDDNYPIVAEKNGDIFFFAVQQWRDFHLLGKVTTTELELTFDYWSFELQQTEGTSYVYPNVSTEVETHIAKRLAMTFVRDQMLPPEWVQQAINERSRYWSALGLLDLGDGFVYRVAKGILLERFERSELTAEKLGKIAAGPITLLGSGELGSPGIVQEGSSYRLAYLDEQRNEWLLESEALRLLISGELPSAE